MRISFGYHRSIERLAAVAGLVALGCAQDYRAEFPSWEPTSSLVPLVANRNLALRYIDESWALWQRYGKPDYTYARAYQESADTVVFVVSIVMDREVHRVIRLEMSLDSLGDMESYRPAAPLRVVADERGETASGHTIPELYQICRTQIVQQAFVGVRLYFHHWGLLQHCGYLKEECEDCETVSIQSYYEYAAPDAASVTEFFCPDRPGLQPLDSFLLRGCTNCRCTPISDVAKSVDGGFGASPVTVARDERRGYAAQWDCTPQPLPARFGCTAIPPLAPACVGKPAPLADPPRCTGHWLGGASFPKGWEGFDSFRR